MGRNSSSAGESASDDAPAAAFRSIRDRFPFKRNNNSSSEPDLPRSAKTTPTAHKTPHLISTTSGGPFKGKSYLMYTAVGCLDVAALSDLIKEGNKVVDYKYGKLLLAPYSKSVFFAADHLSNVVSCLKESTFCQPRVHSVWSVLVNNLLPDLVQDVDSAAGLLSIKKHKKIRKFSSGEEDLERNLVSFCGVAIEGSLLTSSHDRKKLAFDVLLLLLPKLPASFLHIVLSYKIVQCLMDILSTKDSWLYKVAQHFLKELSEWVVHNDLRS